MSGCCHKGVGTLRAALGFSPQSPQSSTELFIFGDVSFPLSRGARGVLENTHVNNKVDKVDVYCTPLTILEGII